MIKDFRHHDDHDDCLPLRPIGDDDELFHLGEWRYAVDMLVQANVPNVAFFVLRHLVELVLKRIISEVAGEWPWGHDLQQLLERLPRADPLRIGDTEHEVSIRNLVLAISSMDRRGDAARYAFNATGEPSFGDDLCVQPDTLPELAEMLWNYCLIRAGGWHGPSERAESLPPDDDDIFG